MNNKSVSSSDEDDIPLSQRVKAKKEPESSDDDMPLSQRKLLSKSKVKREPPSSDEDDNVPLVRTFLFLFFYFIFWLNSID
jgi:hypothetical protein